MDINQLVISAKNGDKQALNKIIEILFPAIYKICCRYYIKNYELDDLIQISRMSVMKAVEKYNFNSKAGFKTYASSAIINNLKCVLRSECKHNYDMSSNIPLNEETTLEDTFLDEFNIEEDYCKNEYYTALYDSLNLLKPMYRDVLYWIYFQNGKLKNYAIKENISIECCGRRKARALKRLREIMGNENR